MQWLGRGGGRPEKKRASGIAAGAPGCDDPLSELASSELLSLTNVDSGIENAHEQHPHEGAVQQSKR